MGFQFRERTSGESKLDLLVGIEYFELLLHKLTRGLVPISFLVFGLMGSVGVACNFLLAWLFSYSFNLNFKSSQLAGALITIAINFLLNNQLTFRSARLRGEGLWARLGLFYACCSIGLFAQLTVANGLLAGGMNGLSRRWRESRSDRFGTTLPPSCSFGRYPGGAQSA